MTELESAISDYESVRSAYRAALGTDKAEEYRQVLRTAEYAVHAARKAYRTQQEATGNRSFISIT